MNWAPVTMQWPAQATQWMDQMGGLNDMAAAQLDSASERLGSLAGQVTTDLSLIGEAVKGVIATGRAALDGQLGEIPKCVVVTPFQSGVGQGTGYQRFLSAPNLVQRLAEKLEDNTDTARPTGEQYALVILFLGTRFDQMAGVLSKFNALLPIAELQKAERRAQHLFDLDTSKLEMPSAGTLPRWADLPLERCTVLKEASASINGQLARLESYAADSSPLDDLTALVQRKAEQALAQDSKLNDLKELLAGGTPDTSMQARLLGPGDASELRAQLLDGDDGPGHEWVLSSGVMLVGSLQGLSFVRELVGL
ncbi:hypothetical protein [Pseudomonas triticifolii]|uniref:Prophage PSSB64-01 n=1 Tax=Pseudomonas triticifolii TaxID=2762592 RepID=A0ABR7BKI9_9PSED|nr:hypothetical protein [Pseudomonas triticifolii]MBC3957674.1 hypothetical protein [Pseudomonas triticifolii]